MGVLWSFGIYNYFSDDGNTYGVGLSSLVAAQGLFTAGAGGVINYPRGWKMRRVYGVNGANHSSIPVSGNTAAPFVSGGSFSLHGTSYTIEGRIGEKRRVRL